MSASDISLNTLKSGESFITVSLVSATTSIPYSDSLRVALAEMTIPSNSMSAFCEPSEKPCISCSIESVCKLSVTSLPIMEPQVVNCISLISSSGALHKENSSLHGSNSLWVNLNLFRLYLAPSSSMLNCFDGVPLTLNAIFLTVIDITKNYQLSILNYQLSISYVQSLLNSAWSLLPTIICSAAIVTRVCIKRESWSLK